MRNSDTAPCDSVHKCRAFVSRIHCALSDPNSHRDGDHTVRCGPRYTAAPGPRLPGAAGRAASPVATSVPDRACGFPSRTFQVMTVRFRLLGEIRVLRDDEPVAIGHGRLRCLLAALLVDAGRVVPLDTLVDRMWREQVPGRPRDTLYTYLSRLRTVLVGIENVGLAQRSGGYVLTVDADSVDLHRFRRLQA